MIDLEVQEVQCKIQNLKKNWMQLQKDCSPILDLEDLEKLKIHTLIGALLKLECHPCYAMLFLKYALICMTEH